jgi:branched-chain amino acid transport system permease protein
VPYYYIFLVVLVGLLAMTWLLARSRFGFYVRALRSSERGARSLGVPVLRYKLLALTLSAAFTALAGSLYALMIGFADPDSVFGILISVQMVIVAALGGAGTLLGPLIGAIILVPLATQANTMFGGTQTSLTYVIYGGIIMLLCRFEPGGLAEIWFRRSARGKQKASDGAARSA